MGKVDITNKYITIQGWMRTELGLKDNELILYAFIFGFCQDGVGKYEGSLAYIEEWLGIAPKNIRARLKSLIDKAEQIMSERNKSKVGIGEFIEAYLQLDFRDF